MRVEKNGDEIKESDKKLGVIVRVWDQDLCLLQEQGESEKENSRNQNRGTTGKAGGDEKLQKDLAVATWHAGRTH